MLTDLVSLVRIFRMLDSIFREVQGHGPLHLLLSSAAKIGFVWNSEECGWTRPSQGSLHLLAGPWQVFKHSILRAGQKSFFADLCKRGRASGRGCWWFFFVRSRGLFKALSSLPMIGKETEALLRATLAGRCLERFLLGRMRGEPVLCRLYGGTDGDGHLFRECTSPISPLVHLRENPEFSSLASTDESAWLQDLCFGTVGFLVFLVMLAPPWALSDADVALDRLDAALGG